MLKLADPASCICESSVLLIVGLSRAMACGSITATICRGRRTRASSAEVIRIARPVLAVTSTSNQSNLVMRTAKYSALVDNIILYL